MKKYVRNFIEILILIIVGWAWGFFCSKIFPNNTATSMIVVIFGGFALGYILTQVFIWIRNGKRY